MQYIKGTDRTQVVLFPQSLDEIIDPDNEVSIIDLFVESIDLTEFKFHLKGSAGPQPAQINEHH
jgi:transposase